MHSHRSFVLLACILFSSSALPAQVKPVRQDKPGDSAPRAKQRSGTDRRVLSQGSSNMRVGFVDELDALYLKAYQLDHEEGRAGMALGYYRAYIAKAPAGRYVKRARRHAARLTLRYKDLARIPDFETEQRRQRVTKGRRVKLGELSTFDSQRRQRKLDAAARESARRGFFLQAARYRTQHAREIVWDQLRYWVAADAREIESLRLERDMHVRFGNRFRAQDVDRALREIVALNDRRTLVSDVMRRLIEKESWVGPNTFAIFLVDLEEDLTVDWQGRIEDFRIWLARQAAKTDANERETKAAAELAADIREIEKRIKDRDLKGAQEVCDRIWRWATQS